MNLDFFKQKSFWTHVAAVAGGVLVAIGSGTDAVQAILTALRGLLGGQ